MDPFSMSKRLVTKIDKNSPPSATQKETVRDHKIYVVKTMTDTTIWANLLPFCADYTLYQGLLCYGYYKYYNYQRQRRLLATTAYADDDEETETENNNNITTITDDDDKALAKDLLSKSSRLVVNRGLGLVCSAVGAGIGSVVWPGWGTIVVSSFGDAAAGIMLDDGYFKARQSLDDRQRKDEERDDSISRQVQ